jgi:hypothetical protein
VYSTLASPVTNNNGVFVAIDESGVYGHEGSSDVYLVRQNPGGTWSTPSALWQGGLSFITGLPNPALASIAGINKLNEVLGVGSDGSTNGLPQSYLYDPNSNSVLNLRTLGVLIAGGWTNVLPIAIDDQGRMLLQAAPSPTSGDRSEHTLLLTPEGVSSPPFAVPAPEPGATALAVLTITGLALRRAVRGRPRS